MEYWKLWKLSAKNSARLPKIIRLPEMLTGHQIYYLKDGEYLCECTRHCLYQELPLHHAKAEVQVLKN